MLLLVGTPSVSALVSASQLHAPASSTASFSSLRGPSTICMTAKAPGTLILLRHGATEVPAGSTFIGWSDPDLSKQGELQTAEAARALLEAGYSFDICYTSVLKRAVRTTWLLLQQLEKIHLPVYKHWRLNERCYGALTGERAAEIIREYGEEQTASWRRSFDAKPPAYPEGHRFDPKNDIRYQRWQDKSGKIRPVALPNGESRGESLARVLPAWKREILPELRRGKNVLVVAHGNTVRSIVQSIDGLSEEQVMDLEIPQCIPLVYRFERKSALDAAEDAAEGLSDWVAATTPGSPLRVLAGWAEAAREKFKGRRLARAMRSFREGTDARSRWASLLGSNRQGYRRVPSAADDSNPPCVSAPLCTPLCVVSALFSPPPPPAPPSLALALPPRSTFPAVRGISTSCRSFTTVAPCH